MIIIRRKRNLDVRYEQHFLTGGNDEKKIIFKAKIAKIRFFIESVDKVQI